MGGRLNNGAGARFGKSENSLSPVTGISRVDSHVGCVRIPIRAHGADRVGEQAV